MSLSLCCPVGAAAGVVSMRRRPLLPAALADTTPCRPAAAAAAAARSRQQRARQRRVGPPCTAGVTWKLACHAYRENPQNTDNPQVLPSIDFSPEEAVRVQLEALQVNDAPWPNHGIQTAYEFANDVGGLDPSTYFGFRKDLYHFDHFLGMFATRLPELVNLSGFAITSCDIATERGDAPETAVVAVRVQHAQQHAAGFEFHLRRKLVGPRKGAWTTWMVVRAERQ